MHRAGHFVTEGISKVNYPYSYTDYVYEAVSGQVRYIYNFHAETLDLPQVYTVFAL